MVYAGRALKSQKHTRFGLSQPVNFERTCELLCSNRVCIAAVWLFVFYLSLQWFHGNWFGDIWEHVAVLNELSEHPFSPTHPYLLADAPHAFFSPYLVMAGLLARVTGSSSITMFAVIGVCFAILLPFAYRRLVFSLFGRRELWFSRS